MSHKIDILLATYNGEQFLREQLDSILNQTFIDINVIIHDDNSTDNTVNIIKYYVEKYPYIFTFIDDSVSTGGASQNFTYLLNYTTANYIMFCDQDDIWLENRIFEFYTEIVIREQELGMIPIVVFSDLKVVDQNLQTISESMITYQKLPPQIASSYKLLKCQNVITGCAMIFNKKALEYSLPIPSEILMHDWWIGLITAKNGKNIFLDKKTILYRQHQNNVVGSKDITLKRILRVAFSSKLFYDYIKIKKMISYVSTDSFSFFDFVICKIRINLLRFKDVR